MDRFANDNPSLLNNNMFYTYLLLKNGSDGKKLEGKFPGFVQRHLGNELKQMGKERKYFLLPVPDIYLSGIANNNTTAGGTSRLKSFFVLMK